METSEQEPVSKKPSTPEGESSPKGFQIRVENSDLIFRALQNGISGELGSQLLESPISSVNVDLISEKEEAFNLCGKVDIDFSASMHRGIKYKKVIQSVAKKFRENNPDGEIVERGGNYIITTSKGTRILLGGHKVLGNIYVNTGLTKQIGQENLQVIPAPSSSRENLDMVMAGFIEVFKTTVEETYKLDEKLPPDEELILQPPKEKVNRGKGLSGDMKTPEDLLGKLEIERPDVSFEDIGGQAQAKREIQGVAFALKNPDLYVKWGTKPPKGVILYGPPGTGKTLFAKALASETEARFFHVEASDIASKWYGDSEKIVKNIFQLAGRTGDDTIIFFDEIDAIAPNREGSHEATHRVVSTLLGNMDGIASHKNVMVIASTNRIESIEPALLRAGRFDRLVEVPLPEEEGIKEIFNIHMSKAEKMAERELFDDVDLEEIVSKIKKPTGSDIAEIIRRVLEEKVRQEGIGLDPGNVTTEDVLKQIENYERVKETKRNLGFAVPSKE